MESGNETSGVMPRTGGGCGRMGVRPQEFGCGCGQGVALGCVYVRMCVASALSP